MPATLNITVSQGKNLGSWSTYCVVTYGDESSSTHTVTGEDAEFNASFMFMLHEAASDLVFSIYHYDAAAPDDCRLLSCLVKSVSEWQHNTDSWEWLDMQPTHPEEARVCAQLLIWYRIDDPSPHPAASPADTAQAHVHTLYARLEDSPPVDSRLAAAEGPSSVSEGGLGTAAAVQARSDDPVADIGRLLSATAEAHPRLDPNPHLELHSALSDSSLLSTLSDSASVALNAPLAISSPLGPPSPPVPSVAHDSVCNVPPLHLARPTLPSHGSDWLRSTGTHSAAAISARGRGISPTPEEHPVHSQLQAPGYTDHDKEPSKRFDATAVQGDRCDVFGATAELGQPYLGPTRAGVARLVRQTASGRDSMSHVGDAGMTLQWAPSPPVTTAPPPVSPPLTHLPQPQPALPDPPPPPKYAPTVTMPTSVPVTPALVRVLELLDAADRAHVDSEVPSSADAAVASSAVSHRSSKASTSESRSHPSATGSHTLKAVRALLDDDPQPAPPPRPARTSSAAPTRVPTTAAASNPQAPRHANTMGRSASLQASNVPHMVGDKASTHGGSEGSEAATSRSGYSGAGKKLERRSRSGASLASSRSVAPSISTPYSGPPRVFSGRHAHSLVTDRPLADHDIQDALHAAGRKLGAQVQNAAWMPLAGGASDARLYMDVVLNALHTKSAQRLGLSGRAAGSVSGGHSQAATSPRSVLSSATHPDAPGSSASSRAPTPTAAPADHPRPHPPHDNAAGGWLPRSSSGPAPTSPLTHDNQELNRRLAALRTENVALQLALVKKSVTETTALPHAPESDIKHVAPAPSHCIIAAVPLTSASLALLDRTSASPSTRDPGRIRTTLPAASNRRRSSSPSLHPPTQHPAPRAVRMAPSQAHRGMAPSAAPRQRGEQKLYRFIQCPQEAVAGSVAAQAAVGLSTAAGAHANQTVPRAPSAQHREKTVRFAQGAVA